MDRVVIGVDPRKLSVMFEVVDQRENVVGSGRFTTDKAGFAAMRGRSRGVSAWDARWRSDCWKPASGSSTSAVST
jgi:hypothetical protein